MKNKFRPRVRHNPKKEGRPRKIGVEKGYGPRHAANAKEGEDLTRRDTDTVPAMLTPREAVLNRNAAEMAGRGNIEALNEKGNELAKKGVDLAGGEENMKSKQKLQDGGYAGDPMKAKNPFPNRGPGGVYPQVPTSGPADNVYGGYRPGGNGVLGQPPDQLGGFGGGLGARDEFGRQFSQRNEAGGFGRGHGVPGQGVLGEPRGSGPFPSPMGMYRGPVPVPRDATWQPPPLGQVVGGPQPVPSSPFYPPGQGLRAQGGEEDILGGGESIYGKSAPVQLNAPSGLGDILKAIQAEGAKQGLNAQQIAGILKAFQGMGGAGGSGLSVGAGTGNMDAVGAFQGGISDIGYPPFVAPSADYHADKGGWVGPYDRNYFIPNYG